MKKLSKTELGVLHQLWSSDRPLSSLEIISSSRLIILRGAFVNHAIDSLLEKKIITQAGVYQGYSGKAEVVSYSYKPTISFSDYYMERFNSISPHNMFRLTEALIRSKKLTPKMLQELSNLLANRIQEINLSLSDH